MSQENDLAINRFCADLPVGVLLRSTNALTRRTPATVGELRDQAMLAVLLGCGLRQSELLAFQLEWIQQRVPGEFSIF